MVWVSGACHRDGAPGGRGPVRLCMEAKGENEVLLRGVSGWEQTITGNDRKCILFLSIMSKTLRIAAGQRHMFRQWSQQGAYGRIIRQEPGV